MANQDEKKVRVRIAPSPTGNLHVGTARAALFNELFAKKHGGVFVVRIEDTDKARSKPEFEKNIIEGLTWLGLTWDEGPDIGGPYAPYRQSERGDTYTAALQKLIHEDKAYFCSCLPGRQAGKATDGVKPVCGCGGVSLDKRTVEQQQTLPIKLRVPSQIISFRDAVRGEVTTSTDTFGGDFVIARSKSDPLFHLAVVVDDALMDITHVIRGEDHLSNTAKHILLQMALGYAQPEYAHLPLLLDEKRAKLSKRKSETNLLAYRKAGYLPEAMLNYLAFLGWNPGDEREFFTHEELIEEFSVERVQKGGAIFSLSKLQAMNKHYLRLKTPEQFIHEATAYSTATFGEPLRVSNPTSSLFAERERAATWQELFDNTTYYRDDWQPDYPPALLLWKGKLTREGTAERLKKFIEYFKQLAEENFKKDQLQDLLLKWIDNESLGRGETLWPVRAALTGLEQSQSPFEVMEGLGKAKSLERLQIGYQKMVE